MCKPHRGNISRAYGGTRCSLSSPGSKPEVSPFTLISSKAFGQGRVLKYAPPPAAEMGANLHRKRAHLHLTKDTIAPNVPVLTLDIGATGIRALM